MGVVACLAVAGSGAGRCSGTTTLKVRPPGGAWCGITGLAPAGPPQGQRRMPIGDRFFTACSPELASLQLSVYLARQLAGLADEVEHLQSWLAA